MKGTENDVERGKRIVYVRVSILNLPSQSAFALWLGGVTRGAVGNWERGKDISLDNLALIAQKASVPFDWLAFGTGPRPAPTDPAGGAGGTRQSNDALEEVLAIYDALPEAAQKEFLRRALGLEERGQSAQAASAVSKKVGEEPR